MGGVLEGERHDRLGSTARRVLVVVWLSPGIEDRERELVEGLSQKTEDRGRGVTGCE